MVGQEQTLKLKQRQIKEGGEGKGRGEGGKKRETKSMYMIKTDYNWFLNKDTENQKEMGNIFKIREEKLF